MKQLYKAANEATSLVENLTTATQDKAVFDSADFNDATVMDSCGVAAELSSALPSYRRADGREVNGFSAVAAGVLKGVKEYTRLHGIAPSGGLIHTALQTANSLLNPNAVKNGQRSVVMDSVDSLSDAPMVSATAQLAIYQSITSAVPFGGYVPMDKGMHGKIIVAGHRAASATGDYKQYDSLDGIYGGKTFLSSTRVVDAASGDQAAFTATVKLANEDAQGSPVVASATKVLVNGLVVAESSIKASRADTTSVLSGAFRLQVNGADKNYAVTGTVTNATGEVALTFTPALEASHAVAVEANIDFEHPLLKEKRPVVEAAATAYDLVAHTYSGRYRITQEAQLQWQRDVGLQGSVEAVYALRQQAAAERHFRAIKSMYRVGKSFIQAFDMKGTARQDHRSRASVFEDAMIAVDLADQAMLERTNSTGVRVIYVGSKGSSYLRSLPNTIFQPSGIAAQAGIYRIGTLRGLYEVYFVPGLLNETADSFEMLCIGRNDQIGLNPYVVGDVTGAILLPLAVNEDLSQGQGFFQCAVDGINPHMQAAQAAAVVQFTNVG